MFMGRYFFCLFCAFINIISAYAQEESKNVVIIKFTNAGPDTDRAKQWVANYQSYITMAFIKDKRFTILERDQWEIIERERELQKSESFIDGKIIQQGESIGAQYIISGVGDPNMRMATVKLYDVSSGKVLGTTVINFDLYENGSLSEEDLTYFIIKNINKQFLYKYFPLPPVKVVRVLEEDKKGAGKILIAAGSKNGVTRKKEFLVKERIYEQVDEKQVEREVTVGRVRVSEVENDSFSVGTVEEGGKVINEKLKSGVKLFCTTVDHK